MMGIINSLFFSLKNYSRAANQPIAYKTFYYLNFASGAAVGSWCNIQVLTFTSAFFTHNRPTMKWY